MIINNDTVVAANHFGLGARPGELNVINDNAREWLVSQVSKNHDVSDSLKELPGSKRVATIFIKYHNLKRQVLQEDGSKDAMKKLWRSNLSPGTIYKLHAMARSINAVTTAVPFHERLVQFWSNHFAISINSNKTYYLAGPFEVEAIRPNICGHFYDLLLAVEQHPAMLTFLNNDVSIGPNSIFAERRNHRKLGINENLGREMMELHTLGVNGGYTQADVIEVAKAITGWGVGGPPLNRKITPGIFYFNEFIHEPGPRTILGKVYPEDGVRQGEAVIRDLARHPSTAKHIATKLVRHFVSDDPPSACVDRVAGVFLDTEGHLPSVYKALIDSEEAWRDVRGKYKTPQDLIYSSFRALNYVPRNPWQFLRDFRVLGQNLWQPGSPAGWPDTEAAWAGSDSLYTRLEYASMMADRIGSRLDPEYLAASVLGPTVSSHTSRVVRQAESTQQGVALLLSSPEFQRR